MIVTLVKFMCNFTYVAFALNRIALIGKDHGRIVKFMSELDIKVYLAVCFLISSSLSWIKYFKYNVNNFEPHLNYPIPNELNIIYMANYRIEYFDVNMDQVLGFKIPVLLFFIYNSISDVINYVVFVVVIIIIDIVLVVQMKRTLEDKLKWYDKETNSQKYEAKKKENENAINKLIKMVIINTVIGVIFKLPSSFLSVVNLIATFYYRNYKNPFIAPLFGEFYFYLVNTDFFILIVDIYEFLFVVSITIQFFIYMRFDKKFREGYEMIFASKKNNVKKENK